MENFSLQPLGKMLVVLGVVILLIGLFLMFFDRVPMIGKLPGDIIIRRKNFTFFFPLTSMIVISLLLTLVLWIIGKFRGG